MSKILLISVGFLIFLAIIVPNGFAEAAFPDPNGCPIHATHDDVTLNSDKGAILLVFFGNNGGEINEEISKYKKWEK